jgi:methionine synthase II (cobalamin-independent)
LALHPSTIDFIENLINYYISEASSYKQIAQIYADEVKDVTAATLGIIIGCVYSGFLQTYKNQRQNPSLEDTQEFNEILKRRAADIRKAVLSAKS